MAKRLPKMIVCRRLCAANAKFLHVCRVLPCLKPALQNSWDEVNLYDYDVMPPFLLRVAGGTLTYSGKNYGFFAKKIRRSLLLSCSEP